MVLGFISTAMAVTPEPTTFARFVPDRSDDFAIKVNVFGQWRKFRCLTIGFDLNM